MSGLGVNVGHTGGSMMAEAMLAAKSLCIGGKGLLNKGFGGGLFGKKAFESSLKSGGDLVKDVIGKVAKGDIAKTGSITGETADKALSTYLGYDSGASMFDTDTSGSSAIPTEIGRIEESADSVTPVEASSASGIGMPLEVGTVSDVPGTSVPAIADITSSSATAAPEDISLEGAESTSDVMQSPEIQNTDYPSEMNPDMNTDIGTQPEISAAIGETTEMVTADAGTGIQSETRIPESPDAPEINASESSVPELPKILPDYDSIGASEHPAAVIPDTQSGIPTHTTEPESISDSTQAVTDSGVIQATTDGGTP